MIRDFLIGDSRTGCNHNSQFTVQALVRARLRQSAINAFSHDALYLRNQFP